MRAYTNMECNQWCTRRIEDGIEEAVWFNTTKMDLPDKLFSGSTLLFPGNMI
jgi:hypothetical protein